jgi:hypothetical protein
MVMDFAKDSGIHDVERLSKISETTLQGDLTLVLESYEDDLRTPVKSIATGRLIRPLLIQIQKAKVDAALALSALDRLLRSNELNFAFMALLPVLGVCGLTYSWIKRKYRVLQGIGKTSAFELMRNSMRYFFLITSLFLEMNTLNDVSI